MKAAGLISDNINSFLDEQGKCSVMLTGGRSAARLYKAWRDLADNAPAQSASHCLCCALCLHDCLERIPLCVHVSG